MACIPGGPFERGVDPSPPLCAVNEGWECATQNAVPKATIWVQTFMMDLTEVTYEAYKSCEAAGRCNKGGPNYGDFDRPTQPIVGISWYDALKYCEAQGKHLPTEAEWELAARGHEGELYPWGKGIPTCELAVIKDERGRSCGVTKKTQPEKGRVLVVKSRPPGRYGLYDMIGNAQEWVFDWYARDYDSCGQDCLGVNPRGPCDGAEPCQQRQYRVVRGGSWYWGASHANGADRRWHVPSNNPYHHFGFRCAATLQEAQEMQNLGMMPGAGDN